MLHLFFAVAFSAVPLTLYVPPVRSLNLFIATMEDLFRESSMYTTRFYPRLSSVCRGFGSGCVVMFNAVEGALLLEGLVFSCIVQFWEAKADGIPTGEAFWPLRMSPTLFPMVLEDLSTYSIQVQNSPVGALLDGASSSIWKVHLTMESVRLGP
ncbi:hypothetical protein RJ639_047096 [Escallonia herrerae]|uniref:Secreted protein n=1 Tax=Escallonia herrerae TaxID=1293975 RepID=A0AA88WEN5_9ASTE|nr:hypothetical protein RJ639_047096 [Escallonia herrerae]